MAFLKCIVSCFLIQCHVLVVCSCVQAPGAPRHYVAIGTYSPGDSDGNNIAMTMDQKVEVIGINQYGWWWVRATNPTNGEVEEGWVPALLVRFVLNLEFFSSPFRFIQGVCEGTAAVRGAPPARGRDLHSVCESICC